MPDPFPPDPRDLEAQDEVLQVMYWLRGEGLADDVAPADIARFTGASPADALVVLERLVERSLVGMVHGDAQRRFNLTPEGVREGGRRFADEFADLTKPGHGECNDPDCDCRRTGHVEDCRHRA
ncbi:MAG: hypothetical protein H0T71_05790 [Acidobacteria bacterium]|nr:hypothetical protein [Acidobacteriota bacterium]